VFGFSFYSTTKITSRVRYVLFLFIFLLLLLGFLFMSLFCSHIPACMRVSNWPLFDRKHAEILLLLIFVFFFFHILSHVAFSFSFLADFVESRVKQLWATGRRGMGSFPVGLKGRNSSRALELLK
jgi:hypothetical protein